MKAYGIDIPKQLIGFNTSIRKKCHVIRLIIGVTRLLNVATVENAEGLSPTWGNDHIRLIICIDKMSRVFICSQNQIHSFYYPFSIQMAENRGEIFFETAQISNVTCSALSSVLEDFSDDGLVETLLEKYWDIVADLEIEEPEKTLCGRLITFLLSFEPGYLRFDCDELHQNGDVHPREHLDINYSSGAAFKVGLEKHLTCEELIDILNTRTSCYYLGER